MSDLDPKVLAVSGIVGILVLAVIFFGLKSNSQPEKMLEEPEVPKVESLLEPIPSKSVQKKKKKSVAPIELAVPQETKVEVLVVNEKAPVDETKPSTAKSQSKPKRKGKETAAQKAARRDRNKRVDEKQNLMTSILQNDSSEDESSDDEFLLPIRSTGKGSKAKPVSSSSSQPEKKTPSVPSKLKANVNIAPSTTVSAASLSTAEWEVVEAKKVKETEPVSSSSSGSTTSATPVVTPVPEKPSLSQIIQIDAKKIGAIIGPKGANKLALQQATRTEITLPSKEDSFLPVPSTSSSSFSNKEKSILTVPITITGENVEYIKKAIKSIQDLVTKGTCAALMGEDYREALVGVHPMYLPEIIGKGGAHLKAIQLETGVKITIPQVPSSSSSSSSSISALKNKGKSSSSSAAAESSEKVANVKIQLSGLKDGVIRAKGLIRELTQYYHTPITHPGLERIEMDISPSYFNFIIGTKGTEIKHIQGNFKVNVHIPTHETINQNLVIVGPLKGVEGAKKYILKIIDRANGIGKEDDRVELKGKGGEEGDHEEDDDEEGWEWKQQYLSPATRRAVPTTTTTTSSSFATAAGSAIPSTSSWATLTHPIPSSSSTSEAIEGNDGEERDDQEQEEEQEQVPDQHHLFSSAFDVQADVEEDEAEDTLYPISTSSSPSSSSHPTHSLEPESDSEAELLLSHNSSSSSSSTTITSTASVPSRGAWANIVSKK